MKTGKLKEELERNDEQAKGIGAMLQLLSRTDEFPCPHCGEEINISDLD